MKLLRFGDSLVDLHEIQALVRCKNTRFPFQLHWRNGDFLYISENLADKLLKNVPFAQEPNDLQQRYDKLLEAAKGVHKAWNNDTEVWNPVERLSTVIEEVTNVAHS